MNPAEMHFSDEDLVLLYYGEQADGEHLAGCGACQERMAALARDLPLLTEEMPVPARDADYGRWVWFRLRPKLQAARGGGRRAAIAAGIALLILGAFAAGRYTATPEMPIIASSRTPRILRAELGEHLERSQLVLREIENSPVENETDFSEEQERAETLLTPNRLYRQAAISSGDDETARVLEDLEQILLEVAHSPAKVSGDELEEIRGRIRRQGIMFRVKVEEVRQEILEQ